MNTMHILSTMPQAENVNIVNGTLDRMNDIVVELKSRQETTKKRGRKKKVMSTTNTVPENQAAKNYTLGEVTKVKPNTSLIPPVYPDQANLKDGEKSKFSFKIRGNGDYRVARKVFDLQAMDKVEKFNTYRIEALQNFSDIEAMDKEKVLALVNLGLQREKLIEAKKAIGGGNTKKITDFINNFRNLPQFASMVEAKAEGEDKTKQRAAQAKAILEFIKPMTPLQNQLEALLAEDTEDEDDEESESDKSE